MGLNSPSSIHTQKKKTSGVITLPASGGGFNLFIHKEKKVQCWSMITLWNTITSLTR